MPKVYRGEREIRGRLNCQRGRGAAQGDSWSDWKTIRGTSQNGGSRCKDNAEEERRIKRVKGIGREP